MRGSRFNDAKLQGQCAGKVQQSAVAHLAQAIPGAAQCRLDLLCTLDDELGNAPIVQKHKTLAPQAALRFELVAIMLEPSNDGREFVDVGRSSILQLSRLVLEPQQFHELGLRGLAQRKAVEFGLQRRRSSGQIVPRPRPLETGKRRALQVFAFADLRDGVGDRCRRWRGRSRGFSGDG